MRQLFRSIRARVTELAAIRDDPLGWFLEAAQGGPVVRLRPPLPREPIYMINDEELAMQVFLQTDRFTKDTRGQRLMRTFLGVGLLTARSDVWKPRRRVAQPAFRKPKLSVYRGQIAHLADELVTELSAKAEPFDLGERMMHLTLDIATTTLFSDSLDEQEALLLSDAMEGIIDSYSKLILLPFQRPDQLPVPPAIRHRRSSAVLDKVVHRILERRRNQHTDGDDLMHLWMASDLDDKAVRDEVVTMLLAAHETTANALTFGFSLLSSHPAVRRKLIAELDALPEGVPSASEAPYLEAVLKEVLRLYPPAWITARHAAEDIEMGGVTIEEGSLVYVCMAALHLDPTRWDNPRGFDPERWLDPEAHRGAWLPFGAGSRKCIGSHFAMLELRSVFAAVLRSVSLDLEPGTRIRTQPSITLRPAEPIFVRSTVR